MIGDALVAQEAAAVTGNEHVVLDADSTKVFVCFDFVETQELFAVTTGFPLVDECRDEVDAWLVGDDKALFQLATHAQAVGAKLFEVRTRLVVETDIDLAQSFHVVNIHSHHVAQSVRQEHGVGTGTNGLVGVALHEAQFLQTLCHHATDGKVNIHIFHARFGNLQHVVVAGLYNGVDFQLTLSELTRYRHGTCVVRTVVIEFATCIAECQATSLQRCCRRVAMHDLTML